jgi:repressor LexA
LKYYYTNNGAPYLAPANQAYENIYPEESLEIFGIVVGVFRKIK